MINSWRHAFKLEDLSFTGPAVDVMIGLPMLEKRVSMFAPHGISVRVRETGGRRSNPTLTRSQLLVLYCVAPARGSQGGGGDAGRSGGAVEQKRENERCARDLIAPGDISSVTIATTSTRTAAAAARRGKGLGDTVARSSSRRGSASVHIIAAKTRGRGVGWGAPWACALVGFGSRLDKPRRSEAWAKDVQAMALGARARCFPTLFFMSVGRGAFPTLTYTWIALPPETFASRPDRRSPLLPC